MHFPIVIAMAQSAVIRRANLIACDLQPTLSQCFRARYQTSIVHTWPAIPSQHHRAVHQAAWTLNYMLLPRRNPPQNRERLKKLQNADARLQVAPLT